MPLKGDNEKLDNTACALLTGLKELYKMQTNSTDKSSHLLSNLPDLSTTKVVFVGGYSVYRHLRTYERDEDLDLMFDCKGSIDSIKNALVFLQKKSFESPSPGKLRVVDKESKSEVDFVLRERTGALEMPAEAVLIPNLKPKDVIPVVALKTLVALKVHSSHRRENSRLCGRDLRHANKLAGLLPMNESWQWWEKEMLRSGLARMVPLKYSPVWEHLELLKSRMATRSEEGEEQIPPPCDTPVSPTAMPPRRLLSFYPFISRKNALLVVLVFSVMVFTVSVYWWFTRAAAPTNKPQVEFGIRDYLLLLYIVDR